MTRVAYRRDSEFSHTLFDVGTTSFRGLIILAQHYTGGVVT